jgi:hypothetical protein
MKFEYMRKDSSEEQQKTDERRIQYADPAR